MTPRSRRELLCGTAGLLALTAGCLDDEAGDPAGGAGDDDPDGGSGDDGDENDTGDDNDDDGNDDGSGGGVDDLDDSETVAFQHPEAGTEPDVALFRDRDEADDWLEERDVGDDAATEFVADTDFEAASLVALEAGAPTLCYELVLERYAVDGAVDLGAVVSDESGADEVCAQQETTVARFVRATADGEPVTDLSATIVDRDGREREFGVGADTATES